MTETVTLKNHNTFGGIIEINDFSTTLPNKRRINNQIEADKLPQLLKQKCKEEKYKHMTLEDLRKMKLISNTNGRPVTGLTDEQWQKEFNLRKLFVTPYPDNIKKLNGTYYRESGIWNDENMRSYHGATQWNYTVSYINDVLKNIRAGQVDYCYFIFQILTLLQFHYKDLKTKYCEGYWEVWLEK